MKPAPQAPSRPTISLPTKISAQPAPAEAPAPESKSSVILQAPTPELNPRNRVAAEIAQRSNADAETAASESVPVTVDEDVEEITDPGQAEPAPVASAPVADPQPAAPAPTAAPAALPGIDSSAEYEFIVDGVPTKIKGSQVIARVQKGETADHRLELASGLLAEAKRTIAVQAQPPAQGVAPQQPSAPVLDEGQLADLIQYGTKEQAAMAIKALRAPRADAVTQQGLQNFTAQALPRIVESQLAFREGLTVAKRDYGDLLDDPDLRQLFFFKENAARESGDKRPHAELYKAIGDDLRKKLNRPAPTGATAPTQGASPTQTIAEKQAAKAAAPAAPRLASARIEGGGGTAKPRTREDVINDMRKARGQHALTTR